MTEDPTKLFVYGTLRVGRSNHSAIARHVVAVEPATTQGILVSLGSFPALIPDPGIVEGDLLTIEPEALEITDRIEGVAHSVYVRRKVDARLAGGDTVAAWAYFYGDPATVRDRPRLIARVENDMNVYAWHPATCRGA